MFKHAKIIVALVLVFSKSSAITFQQTPIQDFIINYNDYLARKEAFVNANKENNFIVQACAEGKLNSTFATKLDEELN